MIGCAPGEYFHGLIDEIRIYNRALNAGEIAADGGAGLETPSDAPVAAYSFDAGEGEVAEDVTGNAHDGEIEGAEWFNNGKFGKALSFDGENDCVTVADAPDLQLTEELTLEAWVKPQGAIPHDPVIYKQQEGYLSYSLQLGWGVDGLAEGYIGEDEENYENVYSPDPLEANVWTHLAFTYDGATLRIFVNGEEVNEGEAPSTALASNGSLLIGCAPGEYFHGLIDEIRIYNRALDGGEIDNKPPTAPGVPEGVLEDEEGDVGIYWGPSQDQPSVNSGAAVGVTGYLYRYQRPESAWTPWVDTPAAYFELESGAKGEHVLVEVLATDGAANRSDVTSVDLIIQESTLTPEDIGEEGDQDEWKRIDVYDEPPPPKEPGEEAPSKSEYFTSSQPPPTGTNELCGEETENPCGQYHPRLAAQYAYKWIDEDREKTYYNHEFMFLGGNGGDCTNFTSQILWAGGMRFMRTNGYNEPDMEANGEDHFGSYDYGQGSWWEGYYYYKEQLKLFRTPTESFVNAKKLLDHLVEYGLVAYVPKNSPVQKGDVIFYNEHGTSPEKVSHSQTIISVTPHRIWVGQHSSTYIATLRSVRKRINVDRGPQGKAWEYFIYRPIHTQANLNM